MKYATRILVCVIIFRRWRRRLHVDAS